MKVIPWAHVVLIAIVFAAVIAAHGFVPLSAPTVISLAGVIIGWLAPSPTRLMSKGFEGEGDGS